MAKSQTVYVKRLEVWQTNHGTVQKIATRVRKGQSGGGQFHGATNFHSDATTTTAE